MFFAKLQGLTFVENLSRKKLHCFLVNTGNTVTFENLSREHLPFPGISWDLILNCIKCKKMHLQTVHVLVTFMSEAKKVLPCNKMLLLFILLLTAFQTASANRQKNSKSQVFMAKVLVIQCAKLILNNCKKGQLPPKLP